MVQSADGSALAAAAWNTSCAGHTVVACVHHELCTMSWLQRVWLVEQQHTRMPSLGSFDQAQSRTSNLCTAVWPLLPCGHRGFQPPNHRTIQPASLPVSHAEADSVRDEHPLVITAWPLRAGINGVPSVGLVNHRSVAVAGTCGDDRIGEMSSTSTSRVSDPEGSSTVESPEQIWQPPCNSTSCRSCSPANGPLGTEPPELRMMHSAALHH